MVKKIRAEKYPASNFHSAVKHYKISSKFAKKKNMFYGSNIF